MNVDATSPRPAQLRREIGADEAWQQALDPEKGYRRIRKTDQAIIEAACNEENARQMAETNANNGVYLTRLIKDHGVQLRKFSDEIYDSFGEASAAVFEETRQHSALAAKIHDAFAKAREDIGRWTGLADSAFVAQRNRVLKL
jgi:TRAP-type mannitol/chloroaromatic compound transport system substrate-binding protein